MLGRDQKADLPCTRESKIPKGEEEEQSIWHYQSYHSLCPHNQISDKIPFPSFGPALNNIIEASISEYLPSSHRTEWPRWPSSRRTLHLHCQL